MADNVWISRDGNAAAATSWSAGSVPVSNDRVIFEPGASSVSPNSGLDFGATGVNLAELFIAPGWSLPIGSASNPWKSESSVIRHYGSATLYYQSKHNGIELDTRDIYIDSPLRKSPACVFSSAGSSLFLRVNVVSGKVVFESSAVPYSFHVGLPGRGPRDAELYVNYNATDSVFFGRLYSGRVFLAAGVSGTGWHEVYGGEWIQESGVIEEIYVHGGRLTWNGTGGLVRGRMDGGVIDTSQTNRSRTFTSLIQYGGEFIRSSQTTVTNYSDFRMRRR